MMETIVALLNFLLLVLAFMISAARTIGFMVRMYIVQALTLGAIAFLTGQMEQSRPGTVPLAHAGILWLLPVPPTILAIVTPFLLARASVKRNPPTAAAPREQPWSHRFLQWLDAAGPIWLEHGRSRVSQTVNLCANFVLSVLAFVLATSLQTTRTGDPSLAISLALLLNGLLIMIVKADIISQVMGLLVMDQGLYLAAIHATVTSRVSPWFVWSMFLYALITLTILLYILPKFHNLAGDIDLYKTTTLKG
jgi:hydrogenase-4 membrane subunit HyfE